MEKTQSTHFSTISFTNIQILCVFSEFQVRGDSVVKKMAGELDDEAEQTVSIQEYLKGVEEQELVSFFSIHKFYFIYLF